MADSPPAPDDKRLFLLLRKTGLDPNEAYTFVQELGSMAAANLIARFETKLDAQNARLDAKLDAQNAKLDAQTTQIGSLKDQLRAERRILWVLIALLGAAVMRYLIAG